MGKLKSMLNNKKRKATFQCLSDRLKG